MTANEILIPINLWVVLFLISPIGTYLNYHTEVTLYYGIVAADKEDLDLSKRGLQDSLTNPKYNWVFFAIQGIRILLIVALFYYGGLTHGIASLITVFLIAYALTRKVFPPPTSHFWLRSILKSLTNREADYRRDNDNMRADALSEIRRRLMDRT